MDDTVTIIGAGIVGICCALSLQERGIPVRLIDRGDPGQETSFGNAGVISPWSVIPQAMPGIWKKIPGMLLDPDGPLTVRAAFWPRMVPWGLRFISRANETEARRISDAMEVLCQPSIALFRKHLDGTGNEHLIADSYYVHAFRQADRASLDDLDYKIRREKGGQLALIGKDELRRLEPAISPDFKAAVLIKGQARAKSPGRIAQVLMDKALAAGAEFLQREVTKIVPDPAGGWDLYLQGATLRTNRIVLAAGVWSAALLKPLGLKVPLVAERGYHVEFANPGAEINNSVMDVDAKIVASSMENGIRVAGTAEFAAIDAPADQRKKTILTRQAKAMLPNLAADDVRFWMGRRPSLPDSLPALGPIRGHRGLYAAFGHSHYGLMMAPKTGELLADMISDRRVNVRLDTFDPDRFS